jgi:hypothetical protein
MSIPVLVWQSRRYCNGDDEWTEWAPSSFEEVKRRAGDNCFQFQMVEVNPKTEEEKVEINDIQVYEVLHTSSVLMDTFDRHILEHVAVSHTPELKEAATKTLEAMHDFYQLVGNYSRDLAIAKEAQLPKDNK